MRRSGFARRGVAVVSEPGADRGPRAGSPRGVVDATGSKGSLSMKADVVISFLRCLIVPVATAPGSDCVLEEMSL